MFVSIQCAFVIFMFTDKDDINEKGPIKFSNGEELDDSYVKEEEGIKSYHYLEENHYYVDSLRDIRLVDRHPESNLYRFFEKNRGKLYQIPLGGYDSLMHERNIINIVCKNLLETLKRHKSEPYTKDHLEEMISRANGFIQKYNTLCLSKLQTSLDCSDIEYYKFECVFSDDDNFADHISDYYS